MLKIKNNLQIVETRNESIKGIVTFEKELGNSFKNFF